MGMPEALPMRIFNPTSSETAQNDRKVLNLQIAGSGDLWFGLEVFTSDHPSGLLSSQLRTENSKILTSAVEIRVRTRTETGGPGTQSDAQRRSLGR